MLEDLYKGFCADLPEGAEPPSQASGLGISTAEAARLMREVQERKKAAAAAAEAERKEREEREELQKAVMLASGLGTGEAGKASEGGSVEAEAESRCEGTNEYECTQCGYTMFPAAGREFKFYGDDFKCPECGCDKSKFVENS